MEVVKAYHGTTPGEAARILAGQDKTRPVWIASDDNNLYLWCPHALIEEGEVDEGDAESHAIGRAFESAQIAAAVFAGMETRIVVLEFEFPRDALEVDDSCENMELARYVEGMDYAAHHVKTYEAKHNAYLDPFRVRFLLDHPHFDAENLIPRLREAAALLGDVEFYDDPAEWE